MTDLFTPTDLKLAMAVNYAAAAVIWLVLALVVVRVTVGIARA